MSMTTVVILSLCIGAVTGYLLYFIIKFSNPYKLIMVFGKKGTGKTTLIAKLALKHIKKRWTVYSTVKLNIPDVRFFDVRLVGNFIFPPRSVIFIDEVGMIWDNRDYKKFRPEVRDYFKLQRHYRNKVYLFSQTFDVDVKLRNLTDYMFMVRNFGGVLSFAQRISRKLVIVEPVADSEGRIADGYELQPLFLQLLGMRVAYITWIPNYIQYFDSYEQAGLPEIPYNVPAVKVLKRIGKWRLAIRSTFFLLTAFLKRALRKSSRDNEID